MRKKEGFVKPPKLAEMIMSRLFPDDDLMTTVGDLEEAFNNRIQELGKFRARLWYRMQIMIALTLLVKNSIYWRIVMFRRTLLLTYRLIKKDKFHHALNILGLSFGIACCVVIFLYLQHELTFDRHHEKSDRIYRIYSTYVTSGEPIRFGVTSPALAPSLKEEFPEIENYVRIMPTGQTLVHQEERDLIFYEDDILYADPSLFSVFDYEFVQGNPATCLDKPDAIVLTEPLARKYFGTEDPLGKRLKVAQRLDLEVTGVIRKPPQNSHLTVDGVISFKTWDRNDRSLQWPMFEVTVFTYVLLPGDYDFTSFQQKWPAFYEKYCEADGKNYGQVFQPIFQRLTDIRYDPTPIRGNVDVGSRAYIYAFFFIGIFILVLACINYVNMTTARSATRAKEVGVKKVLGSDRGNLISQILGESFVITFLAIAAALVLVRLIQSIFAVDRLLGFELNINLLKNPALLAGLGILFLVVGTASGLYPSFYISAVKPVTALSGTFRSGKKGLLLRRILVTSQFVVSLGVIVLMLFMYDQLNFMRNRNLGFNKDNIVSVQVRGQSTGEKTAAIKQELSMYPGVISVTHGMNWPGRPGTGLYFFEGNEGIEEHNYYVLFVGLDYLDTLGIELIKGRDFDVQHSSNPRTVVLVNETLVKELEWEDPIGKHIRQGQNLDAQVIGVVKDFNYRSLHNQIEPLIIRMQPNFNDTAMILKIQGENITGTMAMLEKKWQEINPNRPFEYQFLDQDFGRLYEADQRQNSLVQLFSYVCVFISLLGLLGLSSFNAIRRTKEIAVRKVCGASAARIVGILFREIFIMISIAAAVILPVSMILINMWLKNFAYRANVNVFLFVEAVAGILLIAFLTASYHCIKVAGSNPIKSLRYE